MKQYLDLLQTIKEKGTYKAPAREGMPGTTSLFGYQFRCDLTQGFPLLTTKKISFKNIIVELLWFLKGDTNIKYLIDNGCNIWNEDAYNYYVKLMKKRYPDQPHLIHSYDNFLLFVQRGNDSPQLDGYKWGDCGKQYGWLWRNWEKSTGSMFVGAVDQLKELIEGLKKNPMGRRHIITAWNPATLDDMALNACHAFVQFNCRPIYWNIYSIAEYNGELDIHQSEVDTYVKDHNLPRYYLDCQMYQRSADVFLGVPYNIASYALLTHIIARMTGMVAGDFIHTFGDVHIYDNHIEQVDLQLQRTPDELPKLIMGHHSILKEEVYKDINTFAQKAYPEMFGIKDYSPQATIKAKLSTGLK